MEKINKIIDKLETFAPLSLMPDWDNSGWQIFLENFDIDKVLIALSPDLEVINQAIEKKCGLILSHHPLFFEKINKINANDILNQAVIKAIQNNIQIYSAHINLDIVKGGVADKLAEIIGLKNTCPIEMTNAHTGLGRIGELDKETNLEDFLAKLKNLLNIDNLKLINPSAKTRIKRIALCPGSGGDFIKKLVGVDLYITGDIRYHTALEVNDMIVIDAGHLETERIILPTLKNLLKELNITILIAEEKSPWQIV